MLAICCGSPSSKLARKNDLDIGKDSVVLLLGLCGLMIEQAKLPNILLVDCYPSYYHSCKIR